VKPQLVTLNKSLMLYCTMSSRVLLFVCFEKVWIYIKQTQLE